MPQTRNVVFWRNTESKRVFQQQFGRGLRGDKVSIYDYVGSIRNIISIYTINEQIQQLYDSQLIEDNVVEEYHKLNDNNVSLKPRKIKIVID